MIIDSIQNGIVIDHITAGKAMELYRILGLDKLDCTVECPCVLHTQPVSSAGSYENYSRRFPFPQQGNAGFPKGWQRLYGMTAAAKNTAAAAAVFF